MVFSYSVSYLQFRFLHACMDPPLEDYYLSAPRLCTCFPTRPTVDKLGHADEIPPKFCRLFATLNFRSLSNLRKALQRIRYCACTFKRFFVGCATALICFCTVPACSPERRMQ